MPGLWWFEVRNVLLVNERRGRISEADTAGFLRNLSRLGVTLDRSPDEAALLSLARRYRLTVCDASYLELARRDRLPLATLDTDPCSCRSGGRPGPHRRGALLTAALASASHCG